MTRGAWGLAAALALATGCAHARRVGGDQGDQGEAKQGEAKQGERSASKQGAKGGERRASPAPSKEGGVATAAKVPAHDGHPAVASSPAALMQAGGAKKIQQALADHGALDRNDVTGRLDDRTAAALKKFQAQENIAQTGAPDAETLSRLGLKPTDIYQAAKPEEQGTATQADQQQR